MCELSVLLIIVLLGVYNSFYKKKMQLPFFLFVSFMVWLSKLSNSQQNEVHNLILTSSTTRWDRKDRAVSVNSKSAVISKGFFQNFC